VACRAFVYFAFRSKPSLYFTCAVPTIHNINHKPMRKLLLLWWTILWSFLLWLSIVWSFLLWLSIVWSFLLWLSILWSFLLWLSILWSFFYDYLFCDHFYYDYLLCDHFLCCCAVFGLFVFFVLLR
jgi:hypothetical protein